MTNTYVINEYMWYIAGTHYPVYQVIHKTVNGSSTTHSGYYLDANSIGINEVLAESYHFNIFPNPVRDNSRVSIELKERSDVKLVVNDILGNTIQTINNRILEPGIHEYPIDAEQLEQGIYFLVAVVNNSEFSKRMLVIR